MLSNPLTLGLKETDQRVVKRLFVASTWFPAIFQQRGSTATYKGMAAKTPMGIRIFLFVYETD